MRIKEVLAGKAEHDVVTVKPEATVRDLVAMLAEYNIGALVSSIMSSEVRACAATDTVNELMALMTERRFRHVPVVKDDKLVGIVSIGDVVKSRMSELEFERDQLDSYVQSAQT